jgi:hypothetical protein
VIQFGAEKNEPMPALKAGGLYKTCYQQRLTVL